MIFVHVPVAERPALSTNSTATSSLYRRIVLPVTSALVGWLLVVSVLIVSTVAPAAGASSPNDTAVLANSVSASSVSASSVSANSVSPDSVDPGVRDSVVRLYRAVFERSPDVAGLAYWVGLYAGGLPLPRIADEFMVSDEWRLTYGPLGDPEFVDLIYGNVLGRTPDPAGYAYWLGLVSTSISRTDLLVGFSESPEFVALTGTAAPVSPPPSFDAPPAGSGHGRRIVYSNGAQRVWWVGEGERVENAYPVSGRRNVPSPGTYSVYSKSPLAWAGHDGITMNHMIRFARGASLAIGFHSIPRYADGTPMQSEAELGSFRSSGCIRQRDDLAAALYAWSRVGDTVVVVP